MADPGGGGGAPGGQRLTVESQVLSCLRQKAAELLNLFDQLPQRTRLEGLDILQDLVSATITKITAGKVKSVKFVPVEEKKTDKNEKSGRTEHEVPGETEKSNEQENEEHEDEPKVEAEDVVMAEPPAAEQEELLVKMEDEETGLMTEVEKIVPSMDSSEDNLDLDEKPPVLTGEEDNSSQPNPAEVLEQEVPVLGEVVTMSTRTSRRAARKANQRIHQVSVGESLSLDDGLGNDDIKEQDESLPELEPKTRGRQQCRYCAYNCSTTFQLDLHQQRIHSGKRLYECEFCQKTFSAVASLKRHKLTHTGSKEHKCPVCEKQFYQLSQLKMHSVVHTGAKLYKCNECTKRFTNSANLRRHRRIHTGETPYACKECDAKYRDQASLKLHILKHTGEKPYTCELCSKKFKTSSDFRRHERTHTGERNYKCTICGSMFVQGWHLKQHMKMHTNERPYHCQKCDSRFRTKASLQYHTKSHLGIKDYTCHLCQKSFSTKRYLQNHQVIHTAARPYKCSICSARFNQYANMKRHERIHNDARPYKCSVCDKAFKYLNSLQYHEGIHRGEKKICEKCGLAFKSKGGFEKHKCDPLKYKDNVLKTVRMQDLVIQLEPVDKMQVKGSGLKADNAKTERQVEEANHVLMRMPKIVLRIPKKNLQTHKKNKSKKKKSAARKRKVGSHFKIKHVEPYQNQVHFRRVKATSSDNANESDVNNKVKYTKVVFKPVVRAGVEALKTAPAIGPVEKIANGEEPSESAMKEDSVTASEDIADNDLGVVIKAEPEDLPENVSMTCSSEGARHN